ncbi:MAG TPA: lipase family protein [Aquabacterium sp.]|nr:lipase family protein [Aquabacterium sp.]
MKPFKLSLAAALALAVSSACAAPVVGPADDSFFTNPAPTALTGPNGDLLSYRVATVNLGAGATAVNAWNVIYKSTDSRDRNVAVSGTVLVPKAAWTGTGARPTVIYAVGTHGLASGCAPSKQLALGTDYETANIKAALAKGYAVVVSDYRGALAGATSTYLAGKAQGNAVIDSFRAAASVPNSGISLSAPAGIWGYSQGGQTAAFAAEQLSTYAPELKIVGVAAGGIPGDFFKTADYLNGSIGFAFLGSAIVGLGNQYPGQLPINLLANDEGKAALEKISTQCVFQALFENQNTNIAQYTRNGITLEELLAVESVNVTLDAQTLGRGNISVPMYQYHGQADEFIPLDQAVGLKKAYCAKSTKVKFDLYPSEHIVTQFQAAPTVLTWLADRFAGKTADSTCNTTAADPKPTANPGGGDFIVSLKSWPLNASVGLKTLGQTVLLPATSTFTADANVTAQTLRGNLNVPDFKQTLKIIGLPIQVGLKIVPAGETTGSVSVDNAGQLKIRGTSPVDITVTSVLGIPFGECKTVSPVQFPLSFDGPISSLGNGALNFSGTTSFPLIKGCFISAILSGLMSGSGQTYSLTVSPPAPVKF